MRQYMKEEPSDELIGLESHSLLFIPIGIVAPTEGDIAVLGFDNTVIADRDPVGISAQILKNTLSAIERRFAIDNPLLMVKLSSEDFKDTWVLKMTDATREYKVTQLKAAFEMIQELTPEQ
jgi:hypothetical protein